MGTRIGLLVVACALLTCGAMAGGEEGGEDPARQQMAQLMQQQRDLRKNLGAVQKRMKLNEDVEIKQLQEAASQARKALEDKILEKVTLDPEGARLVEQMDGLKTQIAELRKSAQGNRNRERPKRRGNPEAAE